MHSFLNLVPDSPVKFSGDGGKKNRVAAARSSFPLTGKPKISAEDFYLSPVSTGNDVRAVAKLTEKKGKKFFYPPLTTSFRRDGVPAITAAARVLCGTSEKPVYAIVVRLKKNDRFLGCVRLFDIHPGAYAKLGYFFDPACHGRGLGEQAVLRALDFIAHDRHILKDLGLQEIEATVDPENTASYLILKRAGLRLTDFVIPKESPYVGIDNKPRPRLTMKGNIRGLRPSPLYSKPGSRKNTPSILQWRHGQPRLPLPSSPSR